MARTRKRAKSSFSDDETTSSFEDDFNYQNSDENGSDASNEVQLYSDEQLNDNDRGEYKAFALNQYWPHGLDYDEPIKKNSLFLYTWQNL